MGQYIHFLASQQKSGNGIRLNKYTPNIAYFLLEDYCIILYRATRIAARGIWQILGGLNTIRSFLEEQVAKFLHIRQ